jgi:hypothetical protein
VSALYSAIGNWFAADHRREARIMAYVPCTVENGLRASEVSVGVQDADGNKVYLRVERAFIRKMHAQSVLPVGVVHSDPERQTVLIELPHEADSGANRLWVSKKNVRQV